jgi:hypothetical protein
LELAHKNKGKEHPSGGSQLFSATIKRFVFNHENFNDLIMI